MFSLGGRPSRADIVLVYGEKGPIYSFPSSPLAS
jgi:hypothetical protein